MEDGVKWCQVIIRRYRGGHRAFYLSKYNETTFKVVGDLISYGFDRTELLIVCMNWILICYNYRYIYQNFAMDMGAAYIKLSKQLLEEYGVSTSDTSALVNTLGDIKGIKAWAMFVEEDSQIRVRLHSGPIINELAKKYRGGGHPMASGATIYRWSEADEVFSN